MHIKNIALLFFILTPTLFFAQCERKDIYNTQDNKPFSLINYEVSSWLAYPEGINIQVGTVRYTPSSTYDFGTVTVGSASPIITFTILNTGTDNITLNGSPIVARSGANVADFHSTDPSVSLLPPGSSTTFTLYFTPGNVGAREGIITIQSDDVNRPVYSIRLTGVGSPVPAPNLDVWIGGTDHSAGGTLDFGTVTVLTSNTINVTIQNTGSAVLNVTAYSMTGTCFTTDLGNPSINPGSSVNFNITFSPLSSVFYTASFQIISNDPDEGIYDIELQGTGAPVPVPDINLQIGIDYSTNSTYYFTDTYLGKTNGPVTVTIQNLGTGILNISGYALNGTFVSDFSASGLASTIAAGSSSTFNISFTPSGSGTRTATLEIYSDDPDEATYVLNLSGVCLEPDIHVKIGSADYPTGSSYSFGVVQIGTTRTATFTIQNLGTGILTLTGTPPITASAPFTASDPGAVYTDNYNIPAGASVTFTAAFTPTAATGYISVLSISSNDFDESVYTINLSGTGTSSAIPNINVEIGSMDFISGSSYDFGTVQFGTSKSVIFTIQNTGVGGLELSGTQPIAVSAPFSVTNLGTTSIPGGGSTTFMVVFLPSASGNFNEMLTIASNDTYNTPYKINLTGTGSSASVPDIDIIINGTEYHSGSTYDFGFISSGGSSGPVTITIKNRGNYPLNFTAPTLSNATDFSAGTPGSTGLAGGASTTFDITFTPSATGPLAAVLTIISDDPDEPAYALNLIGSGAPVAVPDINVQVSGKNYPSGSTYDFGELLIRTSGPTKTFTIQNLGTAILNIDALDSGGIHSGELIITGPASYTVAPGGTTTFTVGFDPKGEGLRSAYISIKTANDPDEPVYVVNLTRMGIMPLVLVHGNGSSDTSFYDPVSNTFNAFNVVSGTDPVTFGAWSFPAEYAGANYWILLHGGGTASSSRYDPSSLSFSSGPTAIANIGSGTHGFMVTGGSNVGKTMVVCGGTNPSVLMYYNPGPLGLDSFTDSFLSFTNPAAVGSFSLPTAVGNTLVVMGNNMPYYQIFDQSFNTLGGLSMISSASISSGAHAFKIPDGSGMWLVTQGGISAGSVATWLYDPTAVNFISGPSLSANAGDGAFTIPITSGINAGKALIVHGNNSVTTSMYTSGAIVSGPIFDAGSMFRGGLAFKITGGSNKGKYMIIHGGGSKTTTIFNPDSFLFESINTGDDLQNDAGWGACVFPAR